MGNIQCDSLPVIDDMFHAYVHFKTVKHKVTRPVASLKTARGHRSQGGTGPSHKSFGTTGIDVFQSIFFDAERYHRSDK